MTALRAPTHFYGSTQFLLPGTVHVVEYLFYGTHFVYSQVGSEMTLFVFLQRDTAQ